MRFDKTTSRQVSLKPFSAHEVWKSGEGDDSSSFVFSHTSIVAVQNGEIYQGTSKSKPKDIDEASIIKELSPVPREDIFPPCPSNLTRAPEIYIKIPDIALYAPDAKNIIPQRLLYEARIYEILRENPHPNLGQSLGCVVAEDGRLEGLALFKYKSTLFERAHDPSSFGLGQREQCIAAVKSVLEHLHSLMLAHNDLSPLNVMFTDKDEPVLLDFDTCHPIGTELKKGGQIGEWQGIPHAVYKESSTECDLKALEYLDMWLRSKCRKHEA
ncbi:serine threonine kinase [Fusarium sp. NRRL 25303]|nr:serine threonine kinase [Fusarium sp. NRRL 25303]